MEKSGVRRGKKHCLKTTLCERLVEMHGGELGAESLKGQVRIWHTLPA
jgi:hypothetical protein